MLPLHLNGDLVSDDPGDADVGHAVRRMTRPDDVLTLSRPPAAFVQATGRPAYGFRGLPARDGVRGYYLAGPVALVLPAETLSERDADPGERADAASDADERATAVQQVVVVRRRYLVVIVLGVLTLGIQVAGALTGSLPPGLRPVAWLGLLTVSIGFIWLALAWLGPRGRRRR